GTVPRMALVVHVHLAGSRRISRTSQYAAGASSLVQPHQDMPLLGAAAEPDRCEREIGGEQIVQSPAAAGDGGSRSWTLFDGPDVVSRAHIVAPGGKTDIGRHVGAVKPGWRNHGLPVRLH